MTNTRKHDFSLLDPGLTEKGKLQCRELAEFLKHDELAQKIELIVASPLKRTLETTDIALEWLIKDKGIPVVLKPEWQVCCALGPVSIERYYCGAPGCSKSAAARDVDFFPGIMMLTC